MQAPCQHRVHREHAPEAAPGQPEKSDGLVHWGVILVRRRLYLA